MRAALFLVSALLLLSCGTDDTDTRKNHESADKIESIEDAPRGSDRDEQIIDLTEGSLEALFQDYDVLQAEYEVSSVLENNIAKYGPDNLLDIDGNTAWAVTNGIGESVSVVPASAQPAIGLYIVEGYSKSKALWSANNRVKSLRVIVEKPAGSTVYRISIEDDPHFDAYDMQGYGHYFVFPEPLQTDRITVNIDDVYRGTKYDELCVSALEFITRTGLAE